MALVMLVTFLVFLPSLNNGFVYWDDHEVLLENNHYRGLGWDNIRWMFLTRLMCHFQPLTWFTYALDYTLWGMEPRGYHLTSLLFHVGAAGMFFWVARHLLDRALGRDGKDWQRALTCAAGVAALLFAIHPLRVESVAWATERRDVTSGLFFMVTLAAYLRASVRTGVAKKGWLAVSLIAYALSLMGKASGMTLPFVLVVLDVYPLRRMGRSWRDAPAPPTRGVWLEKLPYLAIGVAAAVIAFLGQYHSRAIASMEGVSWFARIMIAFYGTASYVFKTFVPLGLSPLYSPDVPLNPWAWYFVLSGAVVVSVSVGVVLAVKRWPGGLALWIAYLIILGPTSGLVQIGPQIAADRYTYLSCIGWPILVVAGWLAMWLGRSRSPRWRAGCLAATAMIPLALGCLAHLTRRQIGIWRDTGALWQHAIHVDPTNGWAYTNMGNWLFRQGKVNDALEYHRKGIQLRPGRAGSYSDTGALLSYLGRTQEAIQAYEAALRIDSRCLGAHNGLGRILIKSPDPNEIERGLAHLTEALRIDPACAPVRVNLATYYENTRQYAMQARVLREGLQRAGRKRSLLVRLAWLLATCPDQAVRDGREATSWACRCCTGPGAADPFALAALGAALAETGRFPEAVQAAERGAVAARQLGRQGLEAEIKRHVAAYMSGRPWRSGR